MMQHVKSWWTLAGVGLLIVAVILSAYRGDRAAAQGETVVDCSAGQSLAEAVARATAGDTIRIAGTCSETVTITLDDLTLDGTNGNAIIDAAGRERDAILVEGARRVTIQHLTVRNSDDEGIDIRGGASVRLDHVVAEGNADSGIIVVDGASAVITNSTARNNGNDGFGVYLNSTARFGGMILATQNADDGIDVQEISSGVVVNGAVVTATSNGQSPTFESEPFEGVIGGDGIQVLSGMLFFAPGATVTASGNAGYGLAAFTLGRLSAGASTEVGLPGAVTVENNSVLREPKRGIYAFGSFRMSGSLLSLTVRQPDGVAFYGNPSVNCSQVSLICEEAPDFKTCPCSNSFSRARATRVAEQQVLERELHLESELEERP